MKHLIRNFINGLIIGSSMLLPGVSGGSMAIILGVYDKLILAVSQLTKDLKKHLLFLSTYAAGGLIGILLFAKALLYLTTVYEKTAMFLFLGAACGSLPLLIRKAGLSSAHRIDAAFAGIGFMSVILIDFLPEDLLVFSSTLNPLDYLILLLTGIILSVALVLPGISFSYMLLVLGVYTPALAAIEQLQIPFLLALGSGVLLGILLTTKLLGYIMEHHPRETFLLITGFVIGTLKDIFPGFPNDGRIFICFAAFAAGFFIIVRISKD